MRISTMLPLRLAFAAATLCLATACKDERPVSSTLTTAPQRPALTLRNLPADAPTICVANVRQRDRLLAIAHRTAAITRDITALDDVIDDVCR